jgi:D-Tyr-tRNAtyr deacylase
MIIRTRVFEMANGRYHSLSDLAGAMGLSVSQLYRVRDGKRGINEKFIVGAKKAFPNSRLDELFYFVTGQSSSRR